MAMKDALREMSLQILNDCPDLSLATLREDGFPQATTVSFVHDGLEIFIGVGAQSQKADNMRRDERVSATMTAPYERWSQIRGLSMAARAREMTTEAEQAQIGKMMWERFPEIAEIEPVAADAVSFFRITPFILSILDYSRGFGHTDSVALDERDIAETLDSMKHRWLIGSA